MKRKRARKWVGRPVQLRLTFLTRPPVWRGVVVDAMGSHGKVLVSVKWITCPSPMRGASTVFLPVTRFKFYPEGEEIRWALEGQ